MKEKDIIICKFCREVLNRKKALNLGYKYKEIKCPDCGKIIYC